METGGRLAVRSVDSDTSEAGGEIRKPIHKAYTAEGTVAEWEGWTGMRFPESGLYVIKGALQPIHIDIDRDRGVYDDPNVWMEYGMDE
ncbi:hypothetical protein AB6A23_09580 [Paenibacillus tarimensis]